MIDLSGRHASVTGASSGLGRHMAATLAAHGTRVSLSARRVEKLETPADEIAQAGGQAQAIDMDVIPQRWLGDLSKRDDPLPLLASDAGSYVTGATLPVDGGHLSATLLRRERPWILR